jgi:deoxyribonuclease-4
MSIANGLSDALYEGQSIGATCVQLFTHSNRQWHMPSLNEAERLSFFEAKQRTGITCIAAHASYLINLASPKHEVYQRSLHALQQELERCELLALPFLILHPGSYLTGTLSEGILRIAQAVNTVFEKVPFEHTRLLFENAAGQGSSIGTTLPELAELIAQITLQTRIGVCIDLCHACAAGQPLATDSDYHDYIKEFDQTIGLSKLNAFHVNDSLYPPGSRKDRHAHIGQGHIPTAIFTALLQDSRFVKVPKILETPIDDTRGHVENLAVLKKLLI